MRRPTANLRFAGSGCCDYEPCSRWRGDQDRYADLRDRYRDTAKTLDFEGHMAWAESMP
jgi:hypothetical protein